MPEYKKIEETLSETAKKEITDAISKLQLEKNEKTDEIVKNITALTNEINKNNKNIEIYEDILKTIDTSNTESILKITENIKQIRDKNNDILKNLKEIAQLNKDKIKKTEKNDPVQTFINRTESYEESIKNAVEASHSIKNMLTEHNTAMDKHMELLDNTFGIIPSIFSKIQNSLDIMEQESQTLTNEVIVMVNTINNDDIKTTFEKQTTKVIKSFNYILLIILTALIGIIGSYNITKYTIERKHEQIQRTEQLKKILTFMGNGYSIKKTNNHYLIILNRKLKTVYINNKPAIEVR